MIFISYRISDSLDVVDRLDADLSREFGSDSVYRDRSRLEGGHDWTHELEQNAGGCCAMLVIIWDTWASAKFPDGDFKDSLRLWHADDWVRKEIVLALDAGKTIIPVLLNGATMPPEGWLRNCHLERLYKRQGVRLRTNDYVGDLKLLTSVLRNRCPQLPGEAMEVAATSDAKRIIAGGRRPVDVDAQPLSHLPLMRDLERNVAYRDLRDSLIARTVLEVLREEANLELVNNYRSDWITTGIRLSDEHFIRVRLGAGMRDWQRDFAQAATPLIVGLAHSLLQSADAQAALIRICESIARCLRLQIVWPDDPVAFNDVTNSIYSACLHAKTLEDDDVLKTLNELTVAGPK